MVIYLLGIKQGKVLENKMYIYIPMTHLALIVIIKEMRKWYKRAISCRNLRVNILQPKTINN